MNINKKTKLTILFSVSILLIAVAMTYPLVLNFSSYIPGFFSSDENFAPLWESWRINYSFQNHVSLTHTPLIAYPFGIDLYTSGFTSFLWTGIFYIISLLTTPAVTYNLIVFVNLFLSGIFTCALVFYLTKNKASAIFSGILFAFCPYQFVRAWQHFGLTFNQWIPLMLLSAVLLKEKYSKKTALLFLCSLVLLFSFDWTIMYLSCISVIGLLTYSLFFQWKVKFLKDKQLLFRDLQYFKHVFVIGLIAFILLSPQFLPLIIKSVSMSGVSEASAHNVYHRPFEDLFAQSARPLSYLLPASTHPIFGKFTENFIGTSLYGISFTEHTLYLGFLPLILAFVAVRRWVRNRKAQGTRNKAQETEQFYLGFFILLAFAAWLFSQPPWWNIFGFKLYMPSFLMYKVLPMFRAYCRFGIVVMFAIAVLAGFGLKFALERFKTQKSKITVAALFCCIALFEFWNYPPFKVIDVSQAPAVYSWLKGQPMDVVIAEYPLDSTSSNETYKFYQTKHEKKMINGTSQGTKANLIARTITKLSEERTAGVLKWLGVKFVIVHKDSYLDSDLIEDKKEILNVSSNQGLKLIKTFSPEECRRKNIMCTGNTGEIDVYEIVAEPIEPKVN
ncbi:MAG: hypothetical protein PHO70_00230 [Candidatus Omnitrophica bacterium]|nr:hypothetical protein [Candidatus Omnitrophota bacterium]